MEDLKIIPVAPFGLPRHGEFSSLVQAVFLKAQIDIRRVIEPSLPVGTQTFENDLPRTEETLLAFIEHARRVQHSPREEEVLVMLAADRGEKSEQLLQYANLVAERLPRLRCEPGAKHIILFPNVPSALHFRDNLPSLGEYERDFFGGAVFQTADLQKWFLLPASLKIPISDMGNLLKKFLRSPLSLTDEDRMSLAPEELEEPFSTSSGIVTPRTSSNAQMSAVAPPSPNTKRRS